jgi:hypothetical protein
LLPAGRDQRAQPSAFVADLEPMRDRAGSVSQAIQLATNPTTKRSTGDKLQRRADRHFPLFVVAFSNGKLESAFPQTARSRAPARLDRSSQRRVASPERLAATETHRAQPRLLSGASQPGNDSRARPPGRIAAANNEGSAQAKYSFARIVNRYCICVYQKAVRTLKQTAGMLVVLYYPGCIWRSHDLVTLTTSLNGE